MVGHTQGMSHGMSFHTCALRRDIGVSHSLTHSNMLDSDVVDRWTTVLCGDVAGVRGQQHSGAITAWMPHVQTPNSEPNTCQARLIYLHAPAYVARA